MEQIKQLNTEEKALQLNLDDSIYGTIAEIGGGQEVAAYFFKAGAASGSIAKTMSAYDMKFSDEIYGKCDRYVSEGRVKQMLEWEFSLLTERLTERAQRSRFFAFSNTVETINYARTNEGGGWMGIRFFKRPGQEIPNQCTLHVNLKDNQPHWQQNALGKLGVNLIHSCYAFDNPEDIINHLRDNIHPSRVEIDFFSIQGADYADADTRLLSLSLVRKGLSHAVMFNAKGKVMQASESLYRKNILVLRGRFRPVTHVNVDMMISAMREFRREKDVNIDAIFPLIELTLNDLTMGGDLDESDFLERVDVLSALGQTVMITDFQEHYKIASYLTKFTRKAKIGLVLGVNNLNQIFNEKYYDNLTGGILESFSRLFGSNSKLLIYPAFKPGTQHIIDLDSFQPPPHLIHLFEHFKSNQQITSIHGAKLENLHIISDEVLEMIEKGHDGWEAFVPQRVVNLIKSQSLFNYQSRSPEKAEA